MVLDVVARGCHYRYRVSSIYFVDLHQLTLRWACNLKDGRHLYTADLLELEACGSGVASNPLSVPTTLPVDQWEPFLRSHPDREFAAYIRRGLKDGFRVGVPLNYREKLKPASRNHPSANAVPDEVSRHLSAEISAGRLRPVSGACHISPIGMVPKSGFPPKWRLIVDLSSPRNASVNDGISPDLCSVKYATVDCALLFIRQLGRGSLLAKLDLKSAYRMVPVHPDDRRLLGVSWRGSVYSDAALPFGLRSAPKIFSAVADALAWAMLRNGVEFFIHYLDDFLIFGPPESDIIRTSLTTALATCSQLHFPVAAEKTAGPSTSLVFLGVLINTVEGTLSLPPEKLDRLHRLLQQWQGRKAFSSKRELLSLLGVLAHAAIVIRPGRAFVRNLIQASSCTRHLNRPVRLNVQCRSDLMWWQTFASRWNGRELWKPVLPQVTCFTDASGKWGCGAVLVSDEFPRWCQLEWPASWSSQHIASKEMVPILIAASIWGCCWSHKRLVVYSDNMAVVTTIMAGTSRDPALAHLCRCLFFISAKWSFEVTASHVAGKTNVAADALSRDDLPRFFAATPRAVREPSIIPRSLQDWLLDKDASWTSAPWLAQFRSFTDEVWRRHQCEHIRPENGSTCDSASQPA